MTVSSGCIGRVSAWLSALALGAALSPAAAQAPTIADIAAYQTLRDEQLATLPGVGRLTSTIVMNRIVDERPYPLAPPSPRPHPKRSS